MNGIDVIMEVLNASNVQLQIVCVVGGGNIFKATMESKTVNYLTTES